MKNFSQAIKILFKHKQYVQRQQQNIEKEQLQIEKEFMDKYHENQSKIDTVRNGMNSIRYK